MNRETLEKIMDEYLRENINLSDIDIKWINQFIFDKIIPEVIKSVLPKKELKPIDSFWSGYQFCAYQIEMKTKELYGIEIT